MIVDLRSSDRAHVQLTKWRVRLDEVHHSDGLHHVFLKGSLLERRGTIWIELPAPRPSAP